MSLASIHDELDTLVSGSTGSTAGIGEALNSLATALTGAYTAVDTKGGTVPAQKNAVNLPTAVDTIESAAEEDA